MESGLAMELAVNAPTGTDRVRDRAKQAPSRSDDMPPPEADDMPPPEAADADWKPPQTLPEQRLLPVLPFDYDLLPSDFHDYVKDVAERMQVAPDLVAVGMMAALGIVAANARTIHPKHFDNWRVYTNLWGIGIGPPGSMKSPALKGPEHFLDKLEAQEREHHKQRLIEAEADKMLIESERKALKAQLDSAAKAKGKGDAAASIERDEIVAALRKIEECNAAAQPHQRRLKMTDTTVEAMLDRVQRGARHATPVIVWRDEVVGLFNSFERDGHEADRKVYLEGWSGQSISIDRVGRGTQHAKDFTCSIFGGATPGAIAPYVRETTAEGAGADGFLQRAQLLVYPDPLPAWELVDRKPDHMAEMRAFAVFERLYALDEDDEQGKPPALHFADDAQSFFNAWLTNLEHRLRDDRTGWDTEARQSHFSKYRSLMPALALLCHLASGERSPHEPVSLRAAMRAAQWCVYLEAHAERVYALRDRSIEELIVDKIRSGKLTGEIAVRDLHRRFFDQRERKAEDVHRALEELEHLGWVKLSQKTGGRGRPRPVVLINPLGVRR